MLAVKFTKLEIYCCTLRGMGEGRGGQGWEEGEGRCCDRECRGIGDWNDGAERKNALFKRISIREKSR